MDYQFIRNDRAEPAAIFEMGAETLGLWSVSYTHLTLPTNREV